MECLIVRRMLPEHVIGALDAEGSRRVERHLEWCAGCRLEAAELTEGAAAVASSLPPMEPPAELEERVARAVKAAAERGRPGRPRGPLVAALVAASLAMGAFGWAIALSGRVAELETVAGTAQERAQRFDEVVREVLRGAESGRVLSSRLRPVGRSVGSGRAVLFDSGLGPDWALVVVGGLPGETGPYRVTVAYSGTRRRVGTLRPSAPGELATYRIFERNLGGAKWISVKDGSGRTVLRGGVTTQRV